MELGLPGVKKEIGKMTTRRLIHLAPIIKNWLDLALIIKKSLDLARM